MSDSNKIYQNDMTIEEMQRLLSPNFRKSPSIEFMFYTGEGVQPGDATGVFRVNPINARPDIIEGNPVIVHIPDLSILDSEDLDTAKRAQAITFEHIGVDHTSLEWRKSETPGVECSENVRTNQGPRNQSSVRFGDTEIKDGEWISLSGLEGKLYKGMNETQASLYDRTQISSGVTPTESKLKELFDKALLGYKDHLAGTGIKVAAIADTYDDLKRSRALEAEEIRLARTEAIVGKNLVLYGAYLLSLFSDSESLKKKFREQFKQLHIETYKRFLLDLGERVAQIRNLDLPFNTFVDEPFLEKVVLTYKSDFSESILDRFREKVMKKKDVMNSRGAGILRCEELRDIYRSQHEAFYEMVGEIPGTTHLNVSIPFLGDIEDLDTVMSIYRDINGENPRYDMAVTLELMRAVLQVPEFFKKGINHYIFGFNDLSMNWVGEQSRQVAHGDMENDLGFIEFVRDGSERIRMEALKKGLTREQYSLGYAGQISAPLLKALGENGAIISNQDKYPLIHYICASRAKQVPIIYHTLAHMDLPEYHS
jgi:phosphoenolpyruvate synthase/pyruvate phosphate dikinase